MTPDEIIDRANKGDTSLSKRKYSPREQWEAPGGADAYGAGWEGVSLKEKKVADLSHSHKRKFPTDVTQINEPVTLSHGRLGKDRPTLSEGHHRLAFAEHHGIPFIPVEHVMPSQSWVHMQDIMSDRRNQPPEPEPEYPPIKVYRLSTGLTMHTDDVIK
jgi:hypothetical protein